MIGDYELGKASPSLHQLDKIASALGLTTAGLLAEREERPAVSEPGRAFGDTDAPREVHIVDLPLFETVPAGNWSEVSQEETGTYPVLHHLAGPDRVVVRVHGQSMYSTLQDGDLILVDTSRRQARSGEIVYAFLNGATTLKRYRRSRRQVFLTADNHDVEPVDIDDPAALQIRGVAIRLVDRDLTRRVV